MKSSFIPQDVEIANGAQTSAAVDLDDDGGLALFGVIIPDAVEGTALTFTVSDDNSTYYTLRDADGAVSITITGAGGEYVALDPALFSGVRYVKFKMGTAQTGAVTFTACCRVI